MCRHSDKKTKTSTNNFWKSILVLTLFFLHGESEFLGEKINCSGKKLAVRIEHDTRTTNLQFVSIGTDQICSGIRLSLHNSHCVH